MASLGIMYRPTKFSEVVGNKVAVHAIQNGCTKGTIGNCIALVGGSGIGKSTLARIIASVLNSPNKVYDENGMIEPDINSPAVQDIICGRFNRSVYCYNGTDLVMDKLRELTERLAYDSMTDNYNIVLIEEAQTVPTQSFKSFLNLVESKPNVYFILTSTDVKKFSNTFGSDNANQEKNAFRSRLSLYKLQPITTDEISQYLFEMFTTKIDPDGKLGDGILELIPYIAQNSKNNLRNAVNDLGVAIDSECTNKEDLIALLNYTDDEKESDMVISLLYKDKTALKYINDSNDIEGNFNYWFKILSNNALRDMLGEPFDSAWKEKSYKKMKDSGNLIALYDVFNRTQQLCSAYFNSNVFISMLYEYYCGNNHNPKRLVENASSNPSTNSSSTTETTVVKKVKKVVKE